MIIIPWNPPYNRAQLDAIANPISADQPEVVPWALYDTQPFTNASAAPISFFTAVQNDKTLSNMEGPGQLPDPQYMIVQYVAFDLLQPATLGVDAAVNPSIANLSNILTTCRATFTFSMSNKSYGSFPLSMCASTGGVTGLAYDGSAAAAGVSVASVNNGIQVLVAIRSAARS